VHGLQIFKFSVVSLEFQSSCANLSLCGLFSRATCLFLWLWLCLCLCICVCVCVCGVLLHLPNSFENDSSPIVRLTTKLQILTNHRRELLRLILSLAKSENEENDPADCSRHQQHDDQISVPSGLISYLKMRNADRLHTTQKQQIKVCNYHGDGVL